MTFLLRAPRTITPKIHTGSRTEAVVGGQTIAIITRSCVPKFTGKHKRSLAEMQGDRGKLKIVQDIYDNWNQLEQSTETAALQSHPSDNMVPKGSHQHSH